MYGDDTIDVLRTVPSNDTMFCTGIHFDDNIFYKCNGCSEVIGSIIDIFCLNRNSTIEKNGNIPFEDLIEGIPE